MTDVTPAASTDLAIPADGMTGLEDFDPNTDAVIPRLQIDHTEGLFVDGLSGQKFPDVTVVLLGLIKQRVLWEAEVQEDSKGPLCRSLNFTTGNPDIKRYPWKESGFEETENPLPCEACRLKDWGSHPKRDAPWCSEQHTFPLMMAVGDSWAPSLLTIQRSAIKGSKSYLTSFQRSRTPLYTVYTKISLDHRKRGTVNFAVPKFARGDETDQADWPEYAKNYLSIRQFCQTPRAGEEDDDGGPAPAGTVAPEAVSVAPGASTVNPPAPADDDLPF